MLAMGAAACGSAAASKQGPEPTVVISLVEGPRAARTAVPPPTPSPTVTPAPLAQQVCLVSPSRGVSLDYVPPDLVTLPQGPYVGPAVQMRRTAADALKELLDAAAAQKIYLFAVSGYRSADLQKETLDNEIAQYGAAKAYSEVALPGHSEHQLGDAVDVLSRRDPVDMDETFGLTPEGEWLAANAPAYGFVISYPKGKQAITGYVYEPWHIRYLGLQLAQQVTLSGLTITEFLPGRGLDGCPLQNGLLNVGPAMTSPAAITPTPFRR
jgi:D-alanyl-D-alanine carboxypeptidase